MKFTGHELLMRKRERNKIHAKKTRERKKIQVTALQLRITELKEEGEQLRRIADERYTAAAILGLRSEHKSGNDLNMQNIRPANAICDDYYVNYAMKSIYNSDIKTVDEESVTPKRTRRCGKYTKEERERIRRERNRMHAKKTRERNKNFFELSEKIIVEMTKEANLLRSYLLSISMIDKAFVEKAIERDHQFQKELVGMKFKFFDKNNHHDSKNNTESKTTDMKVEDDDNNNNNNDDDDDDGYSTKEDEEEIDDESKACQQETTDFSIANAEQNDDALYDRLQQNSSNSQLTFSDISSDNTSGSSTNLTAASITLKNQNEKSSMENEVLKHKHPSSLSDTSETSNDISSLG
jgi:hypothetical protein